MSKCTWKGKTSGSCHNEAVHDQKSKSGDVWAKLCSVHDAALLRNLQSGQPKLIMGSWIAAQGGPQRAAERTVGLG